jgi:hypothetical protein
LSTNKETNREESLETKSQSKPAVEERRGRYWNYEHNRWSFCSGEINYEKYEETDRDRQR